MRSRRRWVHSDGFQVTLRSEHQKATHKETHHAAQSKRPDTIVLVHGFWVASRSWEHWITRYEAQGYRVLAPAYPGSRLRSKRSTAIHRPSSASRFPRSWRTSKPWSGDSRRHRSLWVIRRVAPLCSYSSIVAMGRLEWRSTPHWRGPRSTVRTSRRPLRHLHEMRPA
jgi:hypothetical protein